MEQELKKEIDFYRWHNLEKNPLDLPDKPIPIISAYRYRFSGNDKLMYSITDSGVNACLKDHDCCFHFVGWRYLDVFEGALPLSMIDWDKCGKLNKCPTCEHYSSSEDGCTLEEVCNDFDKYKLIGTTV